ncbi:MAG: AMP-binding protein [Actinomycetia bacterium]|nr:AMP-binding protein [Actinomycetes bacterium]
MASYEALRKTFCWDDAREALDGLPNGGFNIAHEAVDRHVESRGDDVAIRWLAKSGPVVELTYRTLAEQTSRFASGLQALGYQPPFGVATLAGRVPDLYVAALGTLKAGGVYTPLFSAFGPDPIAMRMDSGRIELLVTTARLYRRKVEPIREALTNLRRVLIIGDGAEELDDPTVVSLSQLLADADPYFEIPATRLGEQFRALGL